MVNLLPIDKRRVVINEYHHRQVVVGGILLALVIFISTLFMIPLWILLDIKAEALKTTRDGMKTSLDQQEADALNQMVAVANQRIDLARDVLTYWRPLEILDLIDRATLPGVEVTQITFDQMSNDDISLILQGRADRRQFLLDFIQALERSPIVVKVDSPPANLLKEADIDFKLSLVINDQ